VRVTTSLPSRRFDHVLWDWNGTLLDDAALCRAIINEMLQARGKPTLDARQYEEAFGFPVRDYYERVGFDFTSEPFEVPAMQFIDAYKARWAESPLRGGARELLESLADAGYAQSILSAMEQALLEEMTSFHGIRCHLDHLVGLDNHYAASKVDNGRRLIAAVGCPSERVLIVGDTVHDHEVAWAVGAQCLLLPGGHQPRTKLESCGAPVVDSLAEVAEFLGVR
jgi:phosphoglycolate phosphatase